MKTLYLDCTMGAAGDMLTAALTELLPDPDQFTDRLNQLGIPGVQFIRETSVKCGITGTHMKVLVHGMEEGHVHEHHHDHEHHHHGHDHDHEHHHHSSLQDIRQIVSGLDIPEPVREDVMAIYTLIAEAESHAHGVPVTDIHFHEVGTMDAVADITAVCLLIHSLAPDQIAASPVHTGFGQVRCAHGILPVPAPATAFILQGIPISSGNIEGELCTPTGAAILKHFVNKFEEMPVMSISAIGYGMGNKDFEAANCIRAFLGETPEEGKKVLELSCNVDDMTAEEIGYAMNQLFEAGALEVYTIPIGMKKSRPGTLLRVMCTETQKDLIVSAIFRHTTTLGVRETQTRRYVLKRNIETLETPFGPVRRKTSFGYGVERSKYEYDDLCRIASEQGWSLQEVRDKLKEMDL